MSSFKGAAEASPEVGPAFHALALPSLSSSPWSFWASRLERLVHRRRQRLRLAAVSQRLHHQSGRRRRRSARVLEGARCASRPGSYAGHAAARVALHGRRTAGHICWCTRQCARNCSNAAHSTRTGCQRGRRRTAIAVSAAFGGCVASATAPHRIQPTLPGQLQRHCGREARAGVGHAAGPQAAFTARDGRRER